MKNRTILIIILISIAVAVLAGFFASSHPDGLEKVAGNLKFEEKARSTPGVLANYAVSSITHPAFSTALAGIVGIIMILFIFRSISRSQRIIEIIRSILKLR
jgi:ABC-type Fe3+ transport system permease subunit